jgi:uncharacterized protein YehS (DUF1456 family)
MLSLSVLCEHIAFFAVKNDFFNSLGYVLKFNPGLQVLKTLKKIGFNLQEEEAESYCRVKSDESR